MKLLIGIEDTGLLIRPLIINRMHRMTNEGHSIKISDAKEKGNGFCYVEIEDRAESCDVFCDLLADIIIENLQIRYLINVLRSKYYFLHEKTQCELLIKTLKMLWYGKSERSNDIALSKKDVAKRLLQFISESQDKELVLEGFIRFRMKDYVSKWETQLKENVDEFVSDKEYKEFIGVLRYFVMLREPKNITIHLSYNEHEGYKLCDAEKNRIIEENQLNGNPLRQRMTREDIVLSALINISPERIVIHNSGEITEKRFLNTIQNVFLNRVVFEDS